ncbi:MAG: hypothetical protein GC181_14775 [Bacteroidetes bacterium]|nr:hypothetical protein [Bacteroidota bacterium]
MKTKIYHIRNIIFGLLILTGSKINAQSLRIEYDFIKDKVRYYRTSPGDDKGKEILSPVVGRNKMITVEVVNFNNFVYTAQANYSSSKVETQSDMSLMNIITPLVIPGSTGAFFTSLGGNLPEEGDGRGGLMATQTASDAYDDMRDAFDDLTSIASNIQTMEYAIKKLNKLRYNPYLPTDTIVQITDHLIQLIFEKPTVNPTDFTDAILSFNNRLNDATNTFSNASNRFLNAYNDYASHQNGMSFDGQGMDQTVRALQAQVTEVAAQIDPEYITQRIDLLESLYTSIKTTSFTFNSSHAAKDDQIELVLSFYKNPATTDSAAPGMADMNNIDQLSKIKDKKISIIVRGDMKMSTSIGLGFPVFGNNEAFINKDSIITGVPGNNYSPNLAGYINFYPYNGRVANIGGTFGIGVPLTDKNRTVNMFMGACGMFGSQNRVAIHAGATLGQVKILGEGYSSGDQLPSATQEVPTTTNWQWGGFLGISFNIAKTSSN